MMAKKCGGGGLQIKCFCTVGAFILSHFAVHVADLVGVFVVSVGGVSAAADAIVAPAAKTTQLEEKVGANLDVLQRPVFKF